MCFFSSSSGVWYCGNWILVWSLGAPLVVEETDSDKAYEEWRKNSMASRSATYPAIFPGTVSGPDCYQSVIFGTPGMPLTNAAFPTGVTFNAWYATATKDRFGGKKEKGKKRGGKKDRKRAQGKAT